MKWIQESEILPQRVPAPTSAQVEPKLPTVPDFEDGTKFTKYFPGYGNFIGTVTGRDQASGWYTVQYPDGDEEQLDPLELNELVSGCSAPARSMTPWSSNPGCLWNECCSACGESTVEKDDELLKCFFCPQVQHLNCIPIATSLETDIPGEWICPACTLEYRDSK